MSTATTCPYTPQVKESISNGTSLPGCNPIQHGPADAVLQTGKGCEGAGGQMPEGGSGAVSGSGTSSAGAGMATGGAEGMRRRHRHVGGHKG